MKSWRLVNCGYQSGAVNMARDEALLHAVAAGESPPVLRFYRWKPATVTLGYAQSVGSDVDLEVCREYGLDLVRRSTGGRAVLHDEELTYTVIARCDTPPFNGTVLECYRAISAVLLKTLERLGLSAQLVPGTPRVGPRSAVRAVCFTAPSQYELVIDGCKVAGSAQKRMGQAFLQHGSLPVEMDLEMLGRVLRAGEGTATAESLKSVGWLNRYSARPLEVAEVEAVMADEFARQLGCSFEPAGLNASEQALTDQLVNDKFGNSSWNLRR